MRNRNPAVSNTNHPYYNQEQTTQGKPDQTRFSVPVNNDGSGASSVTQKNFFVSGVETNKTGTSTSMHNRQGTAKAGSSSAMQQFFAKFNEGMKHMRFGAPPQAQARVQTANNNNARKPSPANALVTAATNNPLRTENSFNRKLKENR